MSAVPGRPKQARTAARPGEGIPVSALAQALMRHSRAATLAVAMGLALTAMVVWVDQPVARYMAELKASFVNAFQTITWFGKPGWALVPLLAGLAGVWGWRRWLLAYPDSVPSYASKVPEALLKRAQRAIIFILAAMAGAGLIVNLLKPLFGRTRPSELIAFDQHFFAWARFSDTWINSTLNSFPSGHAAAIVSLAAALAWLFPRGKWWFYAAALPVALSRPVVGAHYLSDVLAGAVVAVLWTGWLARRPWFGVKQSVVETAVAPSPLGEGAGVRVAVHDHWPNNTTSLAPTLSPQGERGQNPHATTAGKPGVKLAAKPSAKPASKPRNNRVRRATRR